MPSEKEESGGAVNAGDKMYIDFAGSKQQVTEYDGTVCDVEVFVAILGHSCPRSGVGSGYSPSMRSPGSPCWM